MLSKIQIEALLQSEGHLIIDGALATELEARGHDLGGPLWSAKVLREHPDSIEKVHYDYFIAGAHIAITASYQVSVAGVHEHFGMNEAAARALVARSVHAAKKARDSAYKKGIDRDRPLLIAGSVGPFGAYLADGSEYRGDYDRTLEEFKNFHRPRIEALIDAGADLLALETMPNVNGIAALLSLLKEEFPTAIAWLSCTSRDSGHISDGTHWSDLSSLLHEHSDILVGVGINCVPFATASETLGTLNTLVKLPLVCYPNSGEIWDADSKTWHGADAITDSDGNNGSVTFQQAVSAWTSGGAKLIGGCCRTGPTYVEAVAKQLGLSASI